ncbi:site-specific tyrosine recombinase/integron integrase [Neisseria sp. Ec49-e6-T10]|uniref:site-specific tyrosine recombinase/integron integrase n=1 Tax=Neisseria sp. Ec49-e6-T10 TaxID=3140744 RepID=UPI003EBCD6B7
MAEYIAVFLEKLHQKGKAKLTIQAYQQDLLQLLGVINYLKLDVGSLERNHILYALKQLSAKGQSPKSIARHLSAWRQFCAFLVEESILEYNPCQGVKPPKLPNRLPKALTVENTQLLLDNVQSHNVLEVRDKAIFELMYSSGLRLSEVTHLDIHDLSFSEGIVKVLGKGSKERIVPVGQTALTALKNYLVVRAGSETQKALFTSRLGSRLSNRQIQNRLVRWSELAGSDRRVTPHMFRHSFASHMLQESGDLRAVQELLGHSNLNTTQIYTSLDFKHLATIYDQAHPRAKRKQK